jgi:hypothetical protein
MIDLYNSIKLNTFHLIHRYPLMNIKIIHQDFMQDSLRRRNYHPKD